MGGAKGNAEMELSEEKLALHLRLSYISPLAQLSPEMWCAVVCKSMQKQKNLKEDVTSLTKWPFDHLPCQTSLAADESRQILAPPPP